MPYDLYGTYYASSRDAANAEMAQCASIDADIAMRKIDALERHLKYSHEQPDFPQSNYNEIIHYMQQHISNLEERITALENKLPTL